MALATNYAKNSLAVKYAAEGTYAACYTTAPAATAGTEVSGGTPAYARKAITWSQNGSGVATASVVFDIPTGTTVVGVGVHTAVTAGTYVDGASLPSSQQFTSQGSLTVNFTVTVS